MTKHIRMLI